MSDIHGSYEKYRRMLDMIHFGDQDTLYVLGDVIDRGKEGITTLLDMMKRSNIIPLLGNHEWMAIKCLPWLQEKITKSVLISLHPEQMEALSIWLLNGAITTIEEWERLDHEEKINILDYLASFRSYQTIEVNKEKYLLVHAGLGNYDPNKELDAYTIDELVWNRPDYEKAYFQEDDLKMIVGHTPTFMIHGKPEVFYGKQLIVIDCGAVFPQGRLACLCLDSKEVFYVD